MKRLLSSIVCTTFVLGWATAQNPGNLPLFTANKGQWPDHVAALMPMGPGMQLFVENGGLTYRMWDAVQLEALHHHQETIDSLFNQVVRYRWSPHLGQPTVQPWGESTWKQHFFLGSDRSKWATDVPAYSGMRLTYPTGVAVEYLSSEHGTKYNLHFPTGEALGQFYFYIEGADAVRTSNNRLQVYTRAGVIEESIPWAYQEEPHGRVTRTVHWMVEGAKVWLECADCSSNSALVVDPVVVFSTYSKSTVDNFGYTATYDNNGNVYGGGIAFGIGYPTASGAQNTYAGGAFDVALTKFTPDGIGQVYSSYLGGSGNEQPQSMVVAANGELVVMGTTSSTNFPTTNGAADTTHNGGPSVIPEFLIFSTTDVFVARFSAAGNALVGSTFFGGSGTDGVSLGPHMNYGDASRGEVFVAPNGDVLVAGSTTSTDLPNTSGSAQPTHGGGQDGFVVSFNAGLSTVNWSTYWGGPQQDALFSLRANGAGIYACGFVSSAGLPTGAGVYESTYSGLRDGMVIQLEPTAGSFVRATYNGTSTNDANFMLALDPDGYVVVFGQSKGVYPQTMGLYGTPNSTQFLHKFTPQLGATQYITSIGNGSKNAYNLAPTALEVDSCKNVFLSGWGGETNYEGSTLGLPVTPDAVKPVTDGSDFYFLVLEASWTSALYATFFGGSDEEHVDGGTSRFSPDGTIYQAVCAGCGGNSLFPTSPPNVWGSTNSSTNCNMAVVKIDFETQQTVAAIAVGVDSSCTPFAVTPTNLSYNADTYFWDFGNGFTSTDFAPTTTYTTPGSYTILLVAVDTNCNHTDTTSLVIEAYDPGLNTLQQLAYDSCFSSLQLAFATDATDAATWYFGDGTSGTAYTGTHTYSTTGTYTVVLVKQDTLCGAADTSQRTIRFYPKATGATMTVNYEPCLDANRLEISGGGVGFTSYLWDFGDGTTGTGNWVEHTYASPGFYTIGLQAVDTVCGVVQTVQLQVLVGSPDNAEEIMPNVFTPNGDGTNDYFQIVGYNPFTTYRNFALKVYNRWGAEVFFSAEPSAGWDGNWEGANLPEGVYFWVLEYQDACEQVFKREGFVHLMR